MFRKIYLIEKKMRKLKDDYKELSKTELKKLIEKLNHGCGNYVDVNGFCAYIGVSGKIRLCSTCTRKLKLVKEVLAEKCLETKEE